ncbi:LPXTG cell wall anchor domain-containing protein [Vagococcus jeotgali]|uniref:LPXTG cell wall anchor domain-containing protein n=1 Tax=Vagococcus jeotgali TaxID=3109030 RepID=UPI002DDA6E24|nr:LPXTG cell wall anchor domain-containing protein [Vagococcus sp. B2T-5]
MDALLTNRMDNETKRIALENAYKTGLAQIDKTDTVEGVEAALNAALTSINDLDGKVVQEKIDAQNYVADLFAKDLLTQEQANDFYLRIDSETTYEGLEDIMSEALAAAKENAIKFAQRKYDSKDIGENDLNYFANLYLDAANGDEISAVKDQIMELIWAGEAAMDELTGLYESGAISYDIFREGVSGIFALRSAAEVEAFVRELLFQEVLPGEPGEVIPATPINPDTNVKPGANNNKPATGSTTAGSKESTAKGSTTGSKDSSNKLPQTGEEVRNGLVAGGLASVLGGAALFFRRPR